MKVVESCPFGEPNEPAPCETVGEYKGENVIFRCALYQQVRGVNPQTGQDVDEYMCAYKAMVLGIFDGNKNIRSLASGVESQRNRIDEVNQSLQRIPVVHDYSE